MKLGRRGFLAAVGTLFVPLPEARLIDPPVLLLVRGVPAEIVKLIQTGLLERCFSDSLFPTLIYKKP